MGHESERANDESERANDESKRVSNESERANDECKRLDGSLPWKSRNTARRHKIYPKEISPDRESRMREKRVVVCQESCAGEDKSDSPL